MHSNVNSIILSKIIKQLTLLVRGFALPFIKWNLGYTTEKIWFSPGLGTMMDPDGRLEIGSHLLWTRVSELLIEE